ncbi:unnamed protein product [Leuciscus chuanchicus]
MLMDPCGVMRGSKMGLETRVRQNHCPALFDVDGDSCHHIHNAAAPFSNHLEKLFSDLHSDHQWASDQLTYLREICEFMSIPGSVPKRFVQHHWLLAYDVAIGTQRLLPAYNILYYGFMDREDTLQGPPAAASEHLNPMPKALTTLDFDGKLLPAR